MPAARFLPSIAGQKIRQSRRSLPSGSSHDPLGLFRPRQNARHMIVCVCVINVNKPSFELRDATAGATIKTFTTPSGNDCATVPTDKLVWSGEVKFTLAEFAKLTDQMTLYPTAGAVGSPATLLNLRTSASPLITSSDDFSHSRARTSSSPTSISVAKATRSRAILLALRAPSRLHRRIWEALPQSTSETPTKSR